MFSFLIDIVLDVFTFRRLREHRGHQVRNVSEDAAVMAVFDFTTVIYIGLASAVVMLFLKFMFGLSNGLSIGIGMAVGVICAVWRYMKLVNEA